MVPRSVLHACRAAQAWAAAVWLSASAAGQFVGQPAPEISAPNYQGKEDHFSIATARGKVILLAFLRTDDDPSAAAIPLLVGLHKKYASRGLEVVGMCPEDKEPVEQFVAKHQVPFRYGYGGQPDEAYDVSAFPEAFLIDRSGLIAWRGEVSNELGARIETLLEPGAAAADAGAAARRLAQAAQAEASGDVGKAYTLASSVAATDATSKSKAAEIMKAAEAKARQQVEEVRESIGSDKVDEALCRRAADLMVRFEGSDAGRDAATQVQRLRGHAAGKAHVDAALTGARAALADDRAQDALQSGEFARALRLYADLAEQYATTPQGKEARAAAERIRKDPAAQKALQAAADEDQAQRWLDIGERYAGLKLPDKAREHFDKVLKQFPGSKYAEQARHKMAALAKP